MPSRFANPFPQFLNSTPSVLSGAKLFFYAAGTSTKQDTFSNAGLSVANSNPIVLNSAGYSATDIFLSDLPYKVVLAPSTDTDPPASAIWTADNYHPAEYVAEAKLPSGSGSPNGVRAGTAGSASVNADTYWDTTNNILYVCTTTGSASTAVWTAVNAASTTPVVSQPQGRLTLTSGTPVLTTDATAQTTVYYTPFLGNLVPIYNGSAFIPTTFAELSLALVASHAANTNYDIFAFSNSGVVTLATGPAWTGDTARGTGAGTTQLTTINGFRVNAVAMTGRNGSTTYSIAANAATHLGTMRTIGSNGQTSFSFGAVAANGTEAKFYLWNSYNRVQAAAFVGDSTNSWTYDTTTWRNANASATMRVSFVIGNLRECINARYGILVGNSTGIGAVGIGLDGTTPAGVYGIANSGGTDVSFATAEYIASPTLGYHYVQALEYATAATATFYGDNNVTYIQSGLSFSGWF